ncbi:HAD-like domain-containing protein [Xylariaceae sp. FL1019]|nr:HAD-like domain-containing protein [Xylariaceae sp. FL1019]
MSAQSLSGEPTRILEFINKFDRNLPRKTFFVELYGVILDQNSDGSTIVIGKRIIIVTNNSHRPRYFLGRFLNSIGLEIPEDDIVTAPYITAQYINDVLIRPTNSRNLTWVAGKDVEDELYYLPHEEYCGFFMTIDCYHDMISGKSPSVGEDTPSAEAVAAVVVGNADYLDYHTLCSASYYIQHGAAYLATNLDATELRRGTPSPGPGCAAEAVSLATGKKPKLMGKPGDYMMSAIQKQCKLDDEKLKRTCMIGGSIDSDIKFAHNGGLGGSLLVLTGLCKEEDAKGEKARSLRLTAYVKKLGDLKVDPREIYLRCRRPRAQSI